MKNQQLYNVFHRTWWQHNPAWPNGLEPGAGERHSIAKGVSYAAARALCQDWNSRHDPGPLSGKAEFESV